MKMKILVGSILAVALLLLVSFSNVIGYQVVKTSQKELVISEYDFDYCKKYMFETIVEMSENNKIRDLIKSKSYNPLSNSYHRTLLPFIRNNIDLKVEHLELLFNFGLKIKDKINDNKYEEIVENLQVGNSEIFEQIESIALNDGELKDRIFNLNKMNSEKISIAGYDDYPVLCSIIEALLVILFQIAIKYIPFWGFFYENGNMIIYIVLGLIITPFYISGIICVIIGLFFCFEPWYPYKRN